MHEYNCVESLSSGGRAGESELFCSVDFRPEAPQSAPSQRHLIHLFPAGIITRRINAHVIARSFLVALSDFLHARVCNNSILRDVISECGDYVRPCSECKMPLLRTQTTSIWEGRPARRALRQFPLYTRPGLSRSCILRAADYAALGLMYIDCKTAQLRPRRENPQNSHCPCAEPETLRPYTCN